MKKITFLAVMILSCLFSFSAYAAQHSRSAMQLGDNTANQPTTGMQQSSGMTNGVEQQHKKTPHGWTDNQKEGWHHHHHKTRHHKRYYDDENEMHHGMDSDERRMGNDMH